MKSIAEINELGYFIHTIWQGSPSDWHVVFRSPFEWELWQARGKTLSDAARQAATMARARGPAFEASYGYRARAAAQFVKDCVRPDKRRKRVKI